MVPVTTIASTNVKPNCGSCVCAAKRPCLLQSEVAIREPAR